MIEFLQLGFTYPNGTKALSEISNQVKEGEFVILCGPTGCGKSTLLMTINGLIPHIVKGELKGKVLVEGKDIKNSSVADLATIVGTVFQNPEAQIFNLTCEDEILFGLENLGLSREKIKERMEYIMGLLSMDKLRERNTSKLSGGEKQRLVIGATLAMGSRILILDEPLSDLDPQGKDIVLQVLSELNRKLGITIIVAEHNLDSILNFASRMIVLNKGKIALDGTPGRILSEHHPLLTRIGVRLPQIVEASLAIPTNRIYFTSEEFSSVLRKEKAINSDKNPVTCNIKDYKDNYVIKTEKLCYSYPTSVNAALKDISLSINRDGIVAIAGNNGAGKSTLVKILSGLLKPTSGDVYLSGENIKRLNSKNIFSKVGFLFQNPDNQLFCDTVTEELSSSISHLHSLERRQRVSELLKKIGLEPYRDRHPHTLSRGERQRVALATVLAKKPEVLILDEPTTGQDWKHVCILMDIIVEEFKSGGTIVMITHDMRLIAEYSNQVIVLSNGNLKAKGDPRIIFSQHRIIKESGLNIPPLARASILAGIDKIILSPGELSSISSKVQGVNVENKQCRQTRGVKINA